MRTSGARVSVGWIWIVLVWDVEVLRVVILESVSCLMRRWVWEKFDFRGEPPIVSPVVEVKNLSFPSDPFVLILKISLFSESRI